MEVKKFRNRLRYLAKKLDSEAYPDNKDSTLSWDRQKEAAYKLAYEEYSEKGLAIPDLPMFTQLKSDLDKKITSLSIETSNKLEMLCKNDMERKISNKEEKTATKNNIKLPIKINFKSITLALLILINLATSLLIIQYTSKLYAFLEYPFFTAALFEAFILIFSYEKTQQWKDLWYLKIAAIFLTISMILKPAIDDSLSSLVIDPYRDLQVSHRNTMQAQVDNLTKSLKYHQDKADSYPDAYLSRRDDYLKLYIAPLEAQLALKRDALESASKALLEDKKSSYELPIEALRKRLGEAYPIIFLFLFNVWTAKLAGRKFRENVA